MSVWPFETASWTVMLPPSFVNSSARHLLERFGVGRAVVDGGGLGRA